MARRLAALPVVALLLLLSGCATTNVRAMRAYAHEDPDLVVALDRIDDIAEVLRMLDMVMMKLPYSPGDAWIGELALDDERAEELTEVIRSQPPYDDPNLHVPVVRIYRLHLADVLARQWRRPRTEPAAYPNLMAAVKELTAGRDLGTLWLLYKNQADALAEAEEAYSEVLGKYSSQRLTSGPTPPDLAEATDKRDEAEARLEATSQALVATVAAVQQASLDTRQRKAIAYDTLTAFSVVLRVDLEALALAPFAIANVFRGFFGQKKDNEQLLASVRKRHTYATIADLRDLPELAEQLGGVLERQLELAEGMTESLGTLTGKEIADTAGFELRESVVDQIVGITLDSFHARLNVDAEMLVFGQFGGEEARSESEDSDGNVSVTDITGRTRRLIYDVSPIYMLGVDLDIGFDFIKLPNAAEVGFGYKTDRVFSQGGTIEDTSLGEQLGLSGVASDVFDIGIGLLGVQSDVTIATFDFGRATELEINPATDEDEGVAEDADGDDRITEFELRYTKIDVGYDFSFLVSEWARKWWIEEIYVGYRYFDYRLPRILYEVDGDESFKGFRRQSPAQFTSTRFHMGGFRFRFGPSGNPRVHIFADLGLFFGAGPTTFFFCEDVADPCLTLPDENDRDTFTGTMSGLNGTAGFGGRVRLTPRRWPFQAHAGLEYRAEVISALDNRTVSEEGDEREVVTGGSEVFHGPQLQIRGSL